MLPKKKVTMGSGFGCFH